MNAVLPHLANDFRLALITSTVSPRLAAVGQVHRVAGAGLPASVRVPTYAFLADRLLRRLQPAAVLALGPVVRGHIDVAWVHFCHASAPPPARLLPPLRRLNSTLVGGWARRAEERAYRPERCGVAVACARSVAAELAQHHPRLRIIAAPNGVDSDHFAADPALRPAVRHQHGATAEQLVALFVGGDWGRKGLIRAVEGVALARSGGVDVILWVVGGGDEVALHAAAVDLHIEAAVRCFGVTHDVRPWYWGADVLVLPSAYEAFPLVALESAAAGLPALVSDAGDLGTLVAAGGGIAVRPTAHDIAEALGIAAEADWRHEAGGAARRWAEAHDWSAVSNTLRNELLAVNQ